MIQFLQVSKLYDNDYLALDDVNFEIAEGEFVFLIGPSGSGKTTIIRHLIREERPTEGRIYFDDTDITKFKRNQVYELRRKIGVIFQDYKLINDKNAFENIAFAMEAAGQKPKDIEETVPYVLDIVGLSHRWNAFPAQLSGGEKQRVAIARALSNNPKLLIADEPTGNLDPEAEWDIVQILSKINNWGTTVLMSTHGSEIVDTLGKRVIKLKDGKVKKDSLKGTYKDEDIEIEKLKVQTRDKKTDKKEKEEKIEEEDKNKNNDKKKNEGKKSKDSKKKSSKKQKENKDKDKE
ncbi:cell division ATP-binding protein FtsE, partial [Candidatus Dojkabacteria bacterium]|nr:cell division ATP-binding protein FtsE [Candidatus Dojkabacteria bacterium]